MHRKRIIKFLEYHSTDENQKKDLCFAETLIISCGHYEGDIDDGSSESTWTCRETTTSEGSNEAKDRYSYEAKDLVEEESNVEEEDEFDADFHFFFFPDCKKPPQPENSRTSIVMVDGLPQINLDAKGYNICTCKKGKDGRCECFTKMPCYCGSKKKNECTCRELKDICICHPNSPRPECKCMSANVCICDPDGKIFPECICSKVKKPCICPPFKSPYPICKCKRKPKPILDKEKDLSEKHSSEKDSSEKDSSEKDSPEKDSPEKDSLEKDSLTSELLEDEHEYDYEIVKEESEIEPCECQKPDSPKSAVCFCKKGRECICNVACICGLQRICTCLSTDSVHVPCREQDNKSVCSCADPAKCTCDEKYPLCECFPKLCKCGDPENCKCFRTCECTDPCVCDIEPEPEPRVCTCNDSKINNIICTCPKETGNKLRRVRAGKQGYRWCHEVDPQHTYFDYAYGRHANIEKKEPEPVPFSIQGLHGEKLEQEDRAVHGIKAPKYEKKIRKPSLDCCSAVGGISISVETLGEDKDKFLVQIVSYSSKEGAKTGSKLVSILDSNLHTMEENRTEHIAKQNLMKEKRSYMAICANGYYNKVSRVCGGKNVIKRFYHTFEESHDFLLEGSNIVLMRYFGLSRYRGNIKTKTVLIDGVICESIYVCHGVSQAIVNGTPLFVVKVERHIIEPSGYIHQTMTVLTLRGYIVSHEWADNCYVLHLNPLLRVVPEKDEIEPHAPLRHKWRSDLQLLSDYLDFKSVRTSEGGRFMCESGALTGAVRDYLQAILLLRPQDTLNFTRHYFKSVLSALDLPHDEYFDPQSKHVRYYFFED